MSCTVSSLRFAYATTWQFWFNNLTSSYAHAITSALHSNCKSFLLTLMQPLHFDAVYNVLAPGELSLHGTASSSRCKYTSVFKHPLGHNNVCVTLIILLHHLFAKWGFHRELHRTDFAICLHCFALTNGPWVSEDVNQSSCKSRRGSRGGEMGRIFTSFFLKPLLSFSSYP